MKRTILYSSLIVGFLGYSQTLPFTFSETNQLLNGDGCTTNLTVDAGDDVMQVIGGGAQYDNAQIILAQNVDLSDSANNTITFRIKAIAPTTSGSHLFKFENGINGDEAIEVAFTTTGTEWQDVSLDFDDDIGENPGIYPKMIIFTDFNNSEVGTYLIDDIAGGANVAPVPDLEISAPIPTTPAEEVLSVYGDTGGFTNVWTSNYNFGEATIIDTDPSDAVNEAIKVDFTIAGFGQGTNAGTVTDVSAYDFLHFDYWADTNATQIRMILIEDDGGVHEFNYELSDTGQEPIAFETWTSVDVPLSYFTDLGFSTDRFFQYKLGTESDLFSEIVYFDNIYFTVNEGTSLSTSGFEIPNFKFFPNPSCTVWNLQSSQVMSKVLLFDVLGKVVTIINPNTTWASIEANTLDKGVYFAKISTANGTQTIKLIKN